jgi:UDP-N-acetylglucosamine:LPS N-acetylglucosamine transferase
MTQRAVVVVMTGSLGLATGQRRVSELARRGRRGSDRTIIHVTGRRDVTTEVRPTARDRRAGLPDRRLRRHGAAVGPVTWRSVAAGATTVAELTTLGIPSVLVPLPRCAR